MTENVMPELESLNIQPAKEVIRGIFMERIVTAKGFDKAKAFVGNILMPTPLAVLKGAEILSKGTINVEGMGDIVVVDVGGATTDIHSIADGKPSNSEVIQKGLPEPVSKRTVEGDLGLRINAASIYEYWKKLGKDSLLGCPPAEMDTYVSQIKALTSRTPNSSAEYDLDNSMASIAVDMAIERHAGKLKTFYLPGGDRYFMQTGKDLTEVKCVIGTGGIFKYGRNVGKILSYATFKETTPFSLRPKKPEFYVDSEYMLFACGLLSTVAPDVAARILRRQLLRVAP